MKAATALRVHGSNGTNGRRLVRDGSARAVVRQASGLAKEAPGEGIERLLERLRRVCGEFEGFFLSYMMRMMRKGGLRTDFLSGGLAGDIFTDQFLMALGREAGRRHSLGIAEMLYNSLAPRMQARHTSKPGGPAGGREKEVGGI